MDYTQLPPAVQAVGNLNFEGNIIPHTWYREVTFENGKPDLLGIVILAEILYWYRPSTIKDERTGHVIGHGKHFAADLLQRSYDSIAEQFGCTKLEATRACHRLEARGLLRLVFRDLQGPRGKLRNVLFIEPVADAIRLISFKSTEKVEIVTLPGGIDFKVTTYPPDGGIDFEVETNTESTSTESTDIPGAVAPASDGHSPVDTAGGHSPIDNGAKPEKVAPARKRPDTPHHRLYAAYEDALGYSVPKPPQEAAAIKKLLAAGFTQNQVLACYHALKTDPFWRTKHLSLQTVYGQIGAWLQANPQAETGGPRTFHDTQFGEIPRIAWDLADVETEGEWYRLPWHHRKLYAEQARAKARAAA